MIDYLIIGVGICALVSVVTWIITSIHYSDEINLLNRILMDYYDDENDDDEDSYFHNEYFDDDEEDDED